MSLRKSQSEFTKALALLILYAYQLGFELTISDVQSFPEHNRHRENSDHYVRLAADLNLFRGGKYLKFTESHRLLGEFWEKLGGIWGGRWNDGNHYGWPR